MERFNEENIERQLRKLASWKRIAFMAQIGTRMLPNYERFSKESGFGDVSVLKRAFEMAWTWIETGTVAHDLMEVRDACDRQAPNTEEFSSPYTSAALDAANVASATLDAIRNPTDSRPSEAASLSLDSVDLFVQHQLGIDPSAADFEDSIIQHALMQRELRRQREDLEALIIWTGDRAAASRQLRAMSETRTGSLEMS